jgi:hypothetical protein
MVRFKFLTGDSDYTTYGGKWISNVQNNGEFDYYFVIELINWRESVGERDAPKEKYNVSLSVVSPQQAGEQNIKTAFECGGLDNEMLSNAQSPLAEIQVEALHAYAGGVPIWSANGNNFAVLMKQAHEEAGNASCLFGFYLDKIVNGIGETGWERLKLTDPRTVLNRVLKEHKPTPELQLMDKLTP